MPSFDLGTSKSTLRFCCCMLAMTFSTEFTLLGDAAIARQVMLLELLCIRKLSCGSVILMPWNMNVIVGIVIGTE